MKCPYEKPNLFLTTNECMAVYYSVYQKHLVKGKYLRALKSAARKTDSHARALRRTEIHQRGWTAGYKGLKIDETLNGKELGSLECHFMRVAYERGIKDRD